MINIKTFDITPDISLMPKLGKAGYSSPQAIAKLVDNSIDARIDNQLLEINIKIDKNTISIADNGFGMNEEEDQGREVSLTYPTKIALSQDTEGIPLNDKRIYGQPILFVADRNGVHIIDITGTYWDTIKTTGIQKGAIYGLTVRGYGSGARVYVMDRNTQRVRRFLATPVAIQ